MKLSAARLLVGWLLWVIALSLVVVSTGDVVGTAEAAETDPILDAADAVVTPGDQEETGDEYVEDEEEEYEEDVEEEDDGATLECDCDSAIQEATSSLETEVKSLTQDKEGLQQQLASVQADHLRMLEELKSVTDVKDRQQKEIGKLNEALQLSESRIRELHEEAKADASLSKPTVSLVRTVGKIVKRFFAEVKAFIKSKLKKD